MSGQTGVDYLWWSSNNIMWNGGVGNGASFDVRDDCDDDFPTTPFEINPELRLMPTTAHFTSKMFDPRPIAGGNSYKNVDDVPADQWFTQTDYKGAFSSTDLWLNGWSWLPVCSCSRATVSASTWTVHVGGGAA